MVAHRAAMARSPEFRFGRIGHKQKSASYVAQGQDKPEAIPLVYGPDGSASGALSSVSGPAAKRLNPVSTAPSGLVCEAQKTQTMRRSHFRN